MARRREPRWLTRQMLAAIHESLVQAHSGLTGVRDEHVIESALARPKQKFVHAPDADLADLAAAYTFGIVKNHGFVDGNKRAGFMAAYVFLGLNGLDLDRAEPDVVTTIVRVALGHVSEAALATWFRAGLRAA